MFSIFPKAACAHPSPAISKNLVQIFLRLINLFQRLRRGAFCHCRLTFQRGDMRFVECLR